MTDKRAYASTYLVAVTPGPSHTVSLSGLDQDLNLVLFSDDLFQPTMNGSSNSGTANESVQVVPGNPCSASQGTPTTAPGEVTGPRACQIQRVSSSRRPWP